MPLTAIVENQTVTAPDLSRAEWDNLARRHRNGLPVTMACCGSPGHMRRSGNGTPHFYHAGDGCRYAEESREHREIKARIYQVCRSAGWKTRVEYPSPDRTWISDVYAVKANRKIVFEIQVSPLSPAVLGERDTRYRKEGIESYWLLDRAWAGPRFLASWCNPRNGQPGGKDRIPYLDKSLFETGPENRIFTTTDIRSISLEAKKQLLSTTHNAGIPVDTWVRDVLNGTYREYLEESAIRFRRNLHLRDRAAPALVQFRKFSRAIAIDDVFRKKTDRLDRSFRTCRASRNDRSVQKKLEELNAEIAWLQGEYRKFISDGYGLFRWKQVPAHGKSFPVFRLESEAKVRALEECVAMFSRWEESFNRVSGTLEREILSGKNR